MEGTPTLADLKSKQFTKGFRGYDSQEVDAFLDAVGKAWEKMAREEKVVQKKLATLTEEVGKWKGRETELIQMREKAVVDAEEIRNQASKEAARKFQEVEERAAEIRVQTEEWLEGVLAKLEDMQRQKMNFVTALRSSLDSHYELLKAESLESTPPLGTQLTDFLSQRPADAH